MELKIVISQYERNIEHNPVLSFSFNINDNIKITERLKGEVFSELLNILYKFYFNKTFKISKLMRVDFYLANRNLGSFMPQRHKKSMSTKDKNRHFFRIKGTDYILKEYSESNKKLEFKKESYVFKEKSSYMSIDRLLNSVEYNKLMNKKIWNLEISTPMYG